MTEPPDSAARRARGGRTASLTCLAVILAIAAVLRFAGLDWGLRHPPHVDESVYVANVGRMLRAGDLDHRFYTYPGLFFYLLAPGIATLDSAEWDGPQPYYVSRVLVASCGVLNVALLYFVASLLVGRAAGLAAALLLAVSPLDVQTSHQVRPDVLLEGFGILAIALFLKVGERLKGDALAGTLIGLATAVKFSGLLMVPFYLARRLIQPGPRVRGALLAGGVTIGIVLAATPYAVIHYARYQERPAAQLRMYYTRGVHEGLQKNVASYSSHIARGLGPVATVLVFGGVVLLGRRSPRAWLPPLLHPLTVLLVMSTASLVFPRLMLPGMGILYLCAGAAVQFVAERWRVAGVALALLAAAIPLRGSVRSVNLLVHPLPADEALDWIEAHLPPGSRVLETRPEGVDPGRGGATMLGIDQSKYEVVYRSSEQTSAGELALLAPHFDLVITDRRWRRGWRADLTTVHSVRHTHPPAFWWPIGEPDRGLVAIRLTVPPLRPRLEPVDPTALRLEAAVNTKDLPKVLDGDAGTTWVGGARDSGAEWIEIAFASPTAAAKIELVTRGQPPGGIAPVRVLTRSTASARPDHGDEAWTQAGAVFEREAPAGEGSEPIVTQTLILSGDLVTGIRIVQAEDRQPGEAWRIGELRVAASAGLEPYRPKF